MNERISHAQYNLTNIQLEERPELLWESLQNV